MSDGNKEGWLVRVIPIAQMAVGEEGTVHSVNATGFLRERLLELGVVVGTHIRCERFGPSNTSSIYEVRSARLVIRYSDGAYVLAEVY